MIACAIGRAPGEDFNAERMTAALASMLPALGCTLVISGNWPGVDRCLAEAAIKLRLPYMITESHIVGMAQMPIAEVKRIVAIEQGAHSFLRLGIFKERDTVDIGNRYRLRHSDAAFTWSPGADASRVLGEFPTKARIDIGAMYGA